jgi:hypothetical protein
MIIRNRELDGWIMKSGSFPLVEGFSSIKGGGPLTPLDHDPLLITITGYGLWQFQLAFVWLLHKVHRTWIPTASAFCWFLSLGITGHLIVVIHPNLSLLSHISQTSVFFFNRALGTPDAMQYH